MEKNDTSKDLVEKLSPIERKVLPYISLPLKEIEEKSGLDPVSVTRALTFLKDKKILELTTHTKKIIDLGTNGIYYKKNHLPERKLLTLLESNKTLTLQEAQKLSKLSDNEFKVSLGVLKKKALISLNEGKLRLTASKEELIKKTLEEQLIESLPLELDTLTSEQKYAFESLKSRKEILILEEKKETIVTITELGKKIALIPLETDLIEEVTLEVIKNWNKNKKFRKYDIHASVPKVYGGKRHFVNQSIEFAKKIWLELGFEEMTGDYLVSGFWNFDALFTPQDHPVREMQDTFFIKNALASLPSSQTVKAVKEAHEKGVTGSKGWQYTWKESDAQKLLLRTHTTCLSAQTLEKIRLAKKKGGKYFAIGKCFRNETVDWSHGFEFNQTEGIVVDPKVNFTHLLGYLQEFYRKMGFQKIKIVPSYFPYTEPSVEIYVWYQEKQQWLEIGGAGIFRPEVVIPLLGEYVPVLAWGPGFDRIIMDYYKILDLREMYENDLKKLREKKIWMK